MFDDRVKEIPFLPGEQMLNWCIADYYGKDKWVKMDVNRNGALVLTNQRVVFNGGVALGVGLSKMISIPLDQIIDVKADTSVKTGIVGAFRKNLIITWNTQVGPDSIILLPTEGQKMGLAMANVKGDADEWVRQIMSARGGVSQSAQQNQCSRCRQPLRWVQQYNQWYCDACRQYGGPAVPAQMQPVVQQPAAPVYQAPAPVAPPPPPQAPAVNGGQIAAPPSQGFCVSCGTPIEGVFCKKCGKKH